MFIVKKMAVAVAIPAMVMVGSFVGYVEPVAAAGIGGNTVVLEGRSLAETPAFLGGELRGITTESIEVSGFGVVTASIDNVTGEIEEYYPGGEVVRTTAEERARSLEIVLASANDEQRAALIASSYERISKEDVCPYLVTAIGTVHASSWGAVLAMAAVNPAIAALAALGEGLFWTWVGTHC